MMHNVHNELNAQGGDRKQQKPWDGNPGFHLLVLISELWFEMYHPFCCLQSRGENVLLLLCFCAICISISINIPERFTAFLGDTGDWCNLLVACNRTIQQFVTSRKVLM